MKDIIGEFDSTFVAEQANSISEKNFTEALLHAIGRRFTIAVLQLYGIQNIMLESFERSQSLQKLSNIRIHSTISRLDAGKLHVALKRFDAGVRCSLRDATENIREEGEISLDEISFSRLKHLFRFVNDFVHVSPARVCYENFLVWATRGFDLTISVYYFSNTGQIGAGTDDE